MKEQDFELYDIITGKKVNKEEAIEGKKYIIYYPKDNWKIRTGYINKNGGIETETYLNKDDKITEIKNTLYRILERKGDTNINIDDIQEVKLNNVEIGMLAISVSYQDVNGINRNRILNASTLKDIYGIGEDGQEVVQLDSEAEIHYLRVGKNREFSEMQQDREEEREAQSEKQVRNEYKINNTPTKIYINGGIKTKNLEVSKGNIQIYTKKDGKDLSFDLRTDEGVEALEQYWKQEQEKEQENV